ncbi:MAG: helix-turn-helix domain-containing protein [Brumimicrobium sp.]|nr:helix-turn-helix domain-containing protein [Brumimicrobium sp.]
MKYSKIKNKKQYNEYCKRHLELGKILGSGKGTADMKSEYYILDLIIEDYTSKQKNPFEKLEPVDLLKALMDEYGYSGYKLSKELKVPQSIISDILNYKRGFSKDLIRKFAEKFKLSPESFLKEYELINKESNVA